MCTNMSTLEISFVDYQEKVEILQKKLEKGIEDWAEEIVQDTLKKFGGEYKTIHFHKELLIS